jgi:hypothetical protein
MRVKPPSAELWWPSPSIPVRRLRESLVIHLKKSRMSPADASSSTLTPRNPGVASHNGLLLSKTRKYLAYHPSINRCRGGPSRGKNCGNGAVPDSIHVNTCISHLPRTFRRGPCQDSQGKQVLYWAVDRIESNYNMKVCTERMSNKQAVRVCS